MNWLKKLKDRVVKGTSCCPGPSQTCCGPAGSSDDEIKQAVRENYAELIKSPPESSCCSSSSIADLAGYTNDQLETVPEHMRQTTFACGNPVAIAEVKQGQVVLDIGSGAGLDAILAARKVGPAGKVIGLDMTAEMIETALKNAASAGLSNMEFRLGDAEAMPVDDSSCDWIISNCVINLSPDKGRVFAEAFRVLKPGGRLMISDIVVEDLPEAVRSNMAAWSGCLGGALEAKDYLGKIRAAGFADIKVTAKHTYGEDTIRAMAGSCCSTNDSAQAASDTAALASKLAGRVSSIHVSAVKPA